jgi:hypothetical protein
MIQLVPQLRILLACQPVDFRKGIDSLAALCRARLAEEPFDGTLFVFRNRQGTALKLLIHDGNGFWLCLRRFSQGKLRWWPTAPADVGGTHVTLGAQQLAVLLAQGSPARADFAPAWRRVGHAAATQAGAARG